MIHVAVVDDDQIFVHLVIDAVADRGWDVYGYNTADHLLPLLRRQRPDVMLLDLRLDGCLSGWDVLGQLRLDPSLHQIPVILCSAAIDEIRVKSAWLNEQGIQVLEKPFDLDALDLAMETALWRAIALRVERKKA